MQEKKNNTSVRKGIYLTLIVIAAVAAAILLNIVVGKLPETFTKIDLTSSGMFRLTQQTKDICQNLTEDQHIDMYMICTEGNLSETVSIIRQLLGRYEALSPYISVSTVDATLDPAFVEQYTNLAIDEGSIIVDGPVRDKIVNFNEIFVYDQAAYATTGKVDMSFKGEEAVTAAVSFVTSDKVPTLYVTQGHSEIVPDDGILSYIWADNYEISELSLVTLTEIPADVDCILMNAPQSDITAEEAKLLSAYLDKGGNFYLLTSYNDVEMPNLMEIMAKYGLSADKGVVIDSDANFCYNGKPYNLMPEMSYHKITGPLYAKGLRVIMRLPQSIRIRYMDGVEAYGLIYSSKKALVKPDAVNIQTLEKEEGDLEGSFALGAVAERTVSPGVVSKVVWFGSADLTRDDMDAIVSGNNRDLFMNALAYLCNWEQTISIRSTEINGGLLAPTDMQRIIWGVVLPLIIIVAILIAGTVVWLKRRKR